jgi:penicillin-binding protein 2
LIPGDEGIKKRIAFSGYVIIVVFMAFVLRLWQLQVLNGKQYYAMSEENRIKVLTVAAPRGIIYDRNGKALVKNAPYYSASLLSRAGRDINTSDLASLLSMDQDEVEEKLSENVPPFGTIKLKEGIPFEEVAYIEARRSDFPGLIIEQEITRSYPYGQVASHVVGYLGMQGPEKLEKFKNSDIPPDAFIGKWGVEAYYDSVLRGLPGEKFVEVDALGRQLRIVREERPQKGQDLTISLDIDLQKAMEEGFKGRTGAAVALKPDTGEILALVSLPSFDPNLFSRGIPAKDWKTLNENPQHPFLNRAVQSQYPPGSVFKTVVAAAALEENVLPSDFTVTCNGKIRSGHWEFKCWNRHGHGVVDLHRAIVESCDVFFYQVGGLLGIDKIAEYAEKLGLGHATGVTFADEKKGFIPTTQWKEKTRHVSWYLGETYHSAIGQGYVLTTPIQLAELISALSNDGVIYRPKITVGKDDAEILRDTKFKPSTWKTLREGLRGVVNEPHGTAGAAKLNSFIVSGKTGTAQVVRLKAAKEDDERFRDHAWFVAFAPYEKTEIAMSVLVEHGGHGGSAAAPIAKAGIEEYLNGLHGSEENTGLASVAAKEAVQTTAKPHVKLPHAVAGERTEKLPQGAGSVVSIAPGTRPSASEHQERQEPAGVQQIPEPQGPGGTVEPGFESGETGAEPRGD